MKIFLGDEEDPDVREKILWLRDNFNNNQHKIHTTGFLINEYFVEFFDEKHETLYRIKYPK